jgi:membrane dipeptidase
MDGANPSAARLDTIVVDMTTLSPGYTATQEAFEDLVEMYVLAGINWASVSVGSDDSRALYDTMRVIARDLEFIRRDPTRFMLVRSVADVRRCKAEGRLGFSFNIQGVNPLLGDLNMVQVYRDLGVSHMLLAYNQRNFAADGCYEAGDAGLSAFGVQLIERMNEVGMIVDLTHTGRQSSLEACELSRYPVIFSHSNPKALLDHRRNIDDDQIRACAKTGGVIGVNGMSTFVSADDDISPERFIAMIDHIAALVGVDHVGFGLDYVSSPAGLQAFVRREPARMGGGDPTYLRDTLCFARSGIIHDIAEAMLRRNYSETQTRGVLGENWLRVCAEVWR